MKTQLMMTDTYNLTSFLVALCCTSVACISWYTSAASTRRQTGMRLLEIVGSSRRTDSRRCKDLDRNFDASVCPGNGTRCDNPPSINRGICLERSHGRGIALLVRHVGSRAHRTRSYLYRQCMMVPRSGIVLPC